MVSLSECDEYACKSLLRKSEKNQIWLIGILATNYYKEWYNKKN